MRSNYLRTTLHTATLAAAVLLAMPGVSSAQTVNLTASQQSTTLSDGNTVPMWGFTCGAVTQATGVAATAPQASCSALTYNTGLTAGTHNVQSAAVAIGYSAGGGAWQPPLIVVPYTTTVSGTTNVSATSLTINLTNALPVETSIMILGEAGGGLGGTTYGTGPGGVAGPVREAAPRSDGDHAGQTATTWTTVVPATFNPPAQSARVRSFVPEVPGVATVGATAAVGTYTWTGLRPGTYLIRSGTYPSIQGPMGLYGVLVVTQPPAAGVAGIAYPAPGAATGVATGAVTYDSDVVALLSELDARQNALVAALFPSACTGAGTPVTACTGAGPLPAGATTANAGFDETLKWNTACGAAPNGSGLTYTGAVPTCYPPAVDYTPMYFFVNGVSFSRDAQALSALSVPAPPATGATGNVLVRYVNAGSHMHVPSVNGLDQLMVAEDGWVLPDVALALGAAKTLTASPASTLATAASGLQLRTEVWTAAGQVHDVIVSPPVATGAQMYVMLDRSLELSTDAVGRDGGMQAVLDVNDSGAAALTATNKSATANPDTYAYAPGVTLTISDPGKGVIANDVNVYGVQLTTLPTAGTVTLNPNGTFTYTPTGNGTDSFGYCANGAAAGTANLCTTVSLTVSNTVCTAAGTTNCPKANNDTYSTAESTLIRVGSPGVLLNDVDPNGYPLTAQLVGKGQAALTVFLNPDGSFTVVRNNAVCPPAGCTFTYQAKNSQGSLSNTATVTLQFPTPSNLSVVVQDAPCAAAAGTNATALKACAITDYKWIIQQDLTYAINPACQQNGPGGTKPSTCPAGLPPTPATQFHVSYMPVVAEGCTGQQSCERGQTVYDNRPGSPTQGQHVPAACDGYGYCQIGLAQLPASMPSSANLSALNPDGSKAVYYISILSGDSQNAFSYGNTKDPSVPANCQPDGVNNPSSEPTGLTTASACGHTMGGGPVPAAASCTGTPGAAGYQCTYSYTAASTDRPVVVNLQRNPLKTATVTAFIFEDDFPLNGEPDTGGGVDALATLEKPLSDFQIQMWDDAGGIGDFTGQMTYDMFNMPLTNALNGTIDPSTGFDACPLSQTTTNSGAPAPAGSSGSLTQNIGAIIVCPQYESDGVTPSPLTGQVVVKNLMQGKFSLIAHPGAAREAAGEEWLQTNSLDGTKWLDSFIKVGEPPYFQEFGPGGYHVFFGFANPKHINARLATICAGNGGTLGFDQPFGPPCRNTLNGQVSNLHQGRSPSEQLYAGGVFPGPASDGSFPGDPGNYAPLAYTNCYAAIGDTDGATIALTKCDANGNFTFKGLPDGNYGLVVFDQWNDFIVDGSSRSVTVGGGQTLNISFPVFTWQTHLWSRIYMDTQGKGTPNMLADGTLDPATSPGLIQVPTRVRQTNGKFVNTLFSDVAGNMRFDETFPLFAFYNVEADDTRFRTTGVHVVNDAGGVVDGPAPVGNGNAGLNPYQGILTSLETFSLPTDLRYPGAIYCGANDAACVSTNLTNTTGAGIGGSTGGPVPTTCNPNGASPNLSGCISTGRIDPGSVDVEGWQGGVSEFDMIDWGKAPYIVGENGGIRGHVVNMTTRPFDDPRMLFQNLWEPLVPRVTINLYQEGTAPDGSTSLTLVDTTTTSSFDDWAQGFRKTATGALISSAGGGFVPNMSCPGQDATDPFFSVTMAGTNNFLNPGTTGAPNTLPYNSQYKCYDGYHNLNQVQPAPYDGLFHFPSQTCMTPGATFTVAGNATPYHCVTVANPAYGQTGATGAGALPAVMPPGKYVTEVLLPPGWQLNKEEDLNLLIGDQYIAPATAQFVTLADIFITPDQASIDAANVTYTGPYTSATGVNGTSGPYTPPFSSGTNLTTNNGKQTTTYGRTSFGTFGPGGLINQSAPCVGQARVIPDYLSISPESGEIAPFAGSVHNLCNRKEITLDDQMQADVDFNIYTMTPILTSFTGFISDDFSSEFDPASPAFGEKFAVPNVPVSIRDFNGQEISRTYADQWGIFNGVVYSTWEVDPPNITGYSPNMMVTCMNDPGPILDTRKTITNTSGAAIPNPTYNKMITDPYYNPAYSNFCYENPFMPGDTVYLDTPVVPISAFAEGYNPPDCAYPDGTPMIYSVVNTAAESTLAAGSGPWVSAGGHSITINALAPTTLAVAQNGTTVGSGAPVPNNTYSGPAATTSPYNQKFVTRHYGFGAAAGHVTIGGVAANCPTWADDHLVCAVPTTVPLCNANPSYTGTNASARCGELVVTTASGKQSIDAVTVTVGGTTPKYVSGPNTANNAIQTAIDNAQPGDLVIVSPGRYFEMLLMWKPIRLQGVGDGAVFVDGNVSPSDRLLPPWRQKVNCLFGLALNGGYLDTDPNAVRANGTSAYNPYDPSGNIQCSFGTFPGYTSLNTTPGQITNQSVVDPIPGEPVIGWDATLNGNLAELLQEPTLMGAYEGAGITVLAKGLENNNTTNCNPEGAAGCIPLNGLTGTVTNNGFNGGVGDCNTGSPFYGSNYLCNPSRIDGITFTDSSQGGGGIFVHGFAHNLEIANTHETGNGGTLTGGITIGQMEVVDPAYTATVVNGVTENLAGALGLNTHVNVHNNAVTFNAAYGDELNSNTPASAGGVTFANGADYYQFKSNWVCGNWSSGDGGGMAHHGLSFNGDIENNWFLFNQSINPSLVTYGGGLIAQGAAPDGTVGEAGLAFDVDVAPALSDGVGPNLKIIGNLFQGNTAEEGSGGGLALLHVNGGDVANNPTTYQAWYQVTVSNNIFANNVAGWSGGGVSLLDALNVEFTNNTVASNDSTSSAGVEFNTNGAPNGNVPPPAPPGNNGSPCNPNGTNAVPNPGCPGFSFTISYPLPAGFVTERNSANLAAVFTALPAATLSQVHCPANHGTGSGGSAQCTSFSVPHLVSDIFWQNRAFSIETTSSPIGAVQLDPVLTQSTMGSCPTMPAFTGGSGGGGYWDIGTYSDLSPGTHESGLTLTTSGTSIVGVGYAATGSNPGFAGQYCNGSRVPAEIATSLCTSSTPNGSIANAQGCIQPGTVGVSMTVPGGVPDSLTPPIPAFTISPAATIDEGNNWINMFYGPLTTTCPLATGCTTGTGTAVPFNSPLGNYNHGSGVGANLPAPYPNQ